MTIQEAQRILLHYRPGRDGETDPRLSEALTLARDNPELNRWYEAEQKFHAAISQKLRSIEPPAHLKQAILAQAKPKVVRPSWWGASLAQFFWSNPGWAAAAAIILVAAGVGGFWLRPHANTGLSNFTARMVGTVLREYRMDIVTNDMRQVRQYLASRGAPADYQLPQGLQRLQLTGGGFLTWRNNPVSMVCFDRGDGQMLFLFVMPRSAIKDPPPQKPLVSTSHDLATASWSDDRKVYVLAGPEEPDFERHL